MNLEGLALPLLKQRNAFNIANQWPDMLTNAKTPKGNIKNTCLT